MYSRLVRLEEEVEYLHKFSLQVRIGGDLAVGEKEHRHIEEGVDVIIREIRLHIVSFEVHIKVVEIEYVCNHIFRHLVQQLLRFVAFDNVVLEYLQVKSQPERQHEEKQIIHITDSRQTSLVLKECVVLVVSTLHLIHLMFHHLNVRSVLWHSLELFLGSIQLFSVVLEVVEDRNDTEVC